MTPSVSDSRLNMWRAVIALAHADHKVAPEEREFLMNKIEKGQFSPDQAAILREDIDNPASLETLLPKITVPADRSMLVYYGRLLIWSDDELALQEEKLLGLMNMNALSQVDLERAMTEAEAYARRYAADYEAQVENDPNMRNTGILRWISDLIDRI